MRVRDWQDILRDVTESGGDPEQWRAVGGRRARGVGEDVYFGHPRVGVFQIKTYAKNPYEVRGVGSQVARRIDDELDPLFPTDSNGRFGVRPAIDDESEAERTARDVEEVVRTHADAPTTPDALFEDLMGALGSPAFGPIDYEQYDRTDQVEELADEFEEAERLLEAEFEDIVAETDRGVH